MSGERPVGHALTNSMPVKVDGKVIGHVVSISLVDDLPPRPPTPMPRRGKVSVRLRFRPDWVSWWSFLALVMGRG